MYDDPYKNHKNIMNDIMNIANSSNGKNAEVVGIESGCWIVKYEGGYEKIRTSEFFDENGNNIQPTISLKGVLKLNKDLGFITFIEAENNNKFNDVSYEPIIKKLNKIDESTENELEVNKYKQIIKTFSDSQLFDECSKVIKNKEKWKEQLCYNEALNRNKPYIHAKAAEKLVESTNNYKIVANTIFDQIGRKNLYLLGAKNFLISRGKHSLGCLKFQVLINKNIKFINIDLNGSDLYDITYLNPNGSVVKTSKDIYAEDLPETIFDTLGV